jgi:hypothetical protein
MTEKVWESHNHGLYSHCHVLSVDLHTAEGSLKLSGGTAALVCETLSKVRIHFEGETIWDQVAIEGKQQGSTLRITTLAFDWDNPSTRPETFYLLLITWTPLFRMPHGLMLMPTGKEQGQYRRLGCFRWKDCSETVIRYPEYRADKAAFAAYIEDKRFPDGANWLIKII